MSLLVNGLGEVAVDVFRQDSVLESVCVEVILGQRVKLYLVGLSFEEIIESSVLASGLAFIPVFNFFKAHPAAHLLGLDAVGHPLHEGVAGVRLHVH